MKKICLVVPYYGNWPNWFNITLNTCIANKSINWLFFTDCAPLNIEASNLEFIEMKLKELIDLIHSKIELNINFSDPYKLCDFRPAYGVIFEDYLVNYDFWGHCDIDLVFGNIRSFLTSELLDKIDIFSCFGNVSIPHGPFTIYRNDKQINNLFRKSNDYKKIFEEKEHCAFDEVFWYYYALEDNIDITLDNFYKVLKRESDTIGLNVCGKYLMREDLVVYNFLPESNCINNTWNDYSSAKFKFNPNYLIEWKEGVLYDQEDKKEIIFFHFNQSKDNSFFKIPQNSGKIKRFCITKNGFHIK